MLFAIAVVIAVTSSANKTKKQPAITEPPDTEMPPVTDTEAGPSSEPPETTDRREPAEESRASVTAPESKESETVASEAVPDVSPAMFSPSTLSLPASGILSKRHDTTLQVYSTTMNDYRVHNGIDIVTEAGAPIYAACGGEVSQIWDDPLMGRCLSIKHGEGCYTVYKNLAEEGVSGIEVGAAVGEGQLIASVGETAMTELAEEPHLHFELTVGGEAADPLEYFDDSSIASLDIDASFET